MAPPKSQSINDIGWLHGTPVENNRFQWICNYCHVHGKGGGVSRLKQHLAGGFPNVKACEKCGTEIRDAMKAHLRAGKAAREHKQKNREYIDRIVAEEGYAVDEDYPTEENYDDFDIRDPRIPPGEREEIRRAQAESLREMELAQQRETMRRGGYAQGSSYAPGGSSSGSGSSTTQRGRNRGGLPSFFGRSASMRTTNIRSVDPHASEPVELRQPRIDDIGRGTKKSKLAKAIAKFFHFSHIAPNAASSPYYRNMIAVAEEVGPGIQPPTPRELAGSLLDENVKELREYIKSLKTQWEEYGVTIMCDGWTGPTRLKIINFLISCDGKTVFHESIDASQNIQTHVYIKEKLKKVIADVGVHNVVQIVTDNGANYKLAGLSLMREYQHLYWTPCAAHCIDLMMADIGELPHVTKLVQKGQTITKFIYNHGSLLAQMRQQIGGNLLRPGITRFATNFISLNSIKEKEVGLKALFSGEWWHESRYRQMDKGRKVERIIFDRRFWNNVTTFIDSVAPLYTVFRKVDTEAVPQMGYVYHLIHNAKAQIQRNNEKGYREYCNIIDERWNNQMGQDIHLAGYYLNPRFQYQYNLGTKNELITALRNVIVRLEPNEAAQAHAMEEGKAFRYAEGSFGEQAARSSRLTMMPSEWWLQFGTSAPHLRKVAVKLLSQAVSSSGCERNWSTFALIHTKVRNRLIADRVNKLVYVSYNMRLRLKHMKQQQYTETFDPTLYGGVDTEDDPIMEWVEAHEDDELELDHPGDPPRPNEDIARELSIDPNEFAEREFAPMQQGRQPMGDDNVGGSSQHSRRRNRSPTLSNASSSSENGNSSNSSDNNGGGGHTGIAGEEGHEDTFVPSTQFTDVDVCDARRSDKSLKKYSRRASGPEDSAASLSRSASVSSGRSSALETGWSMLRAGLRSFSRSSNEPHIDRRGYGQNDADTPSPSPSESNVVSQPYLPVQPSDYGYSIGPPYMHSYPYPPPIYEEYSTYPSNASASSDWNMQHTNVDSVSNDGQRFVDEYIQHYHQVYSWDTWVYYIHMTYGIDLNSLGFTDPLYQPHRHSMWQ